MKVFKMVLLVLGLFLSMNCFAASNARIVLGVEREKLLRTSVVTEPKGRGVFIDFKIPRLEGVYRSPDQSSSGMNSYLWVERRFLGNGNHLFVMHFQSEGKHLANVFSMVSDTGAKLAPLARFAALSCEMNMGPYELEYRIEGERQDLVESMGEEEAIFPRVTHLEEIKSVIRVFSMTLIGR